MQKVCFVCLQPSQLKCSRCDAIQYCGKECQKNDWKVHKQSCRDHKIDNEINSVMQKVCFVCLQPSRLKCNRCDAIQYCGKECQKKDWKVHKHNCKDRSIHCEDDSSAGMFIKGQNYFEQGNHHRAEKIFRKLLEPSLRLQYPHFFIVECLYNLSLTLNYKGKYIEAAELSQESLDICRSKLGSNDPYTIHTLDILATSYIKLRKFNQARDLLNECIEKSKIVNGIDHEKTMYYMATLGGAYKDEGRHDEAQKILRECLAKIKNYDNRYVDIMTELAFSCKEKSQYEEAEKLYKECLEKMKVMRGENHPSTIIVMMTLASVYEKQNKPLDQVEAIYKECLAKSMVINGKDNIYTLDAMHNLAVCYLNQGKLDEAEQLYKECLEKSISILGRDHPNTLSTMRILAETYQRQGRYDESIKLNQECLDRRKII